MKKKCLVPLLVITNSIRTKLNCFIIVLITFEGDFLTLTFGDQIYKKPEINKERYWHLNRSNWTFL